MNYLPIIVRFVIPNHFVSNVMQTQENHMCLHCLKNHIEYPNVSRINPTSITNSLYQIVKSTSNTSEEAIEK